MNNNLELARKLLDQQAEIERLRTRVKELEKPCFLFEVTNGLTGESYDRVYVWAESEESAKSAAEESFSKAKYPAARKLEVKGLFSKSSPPFVTAPSDSGFESQ